MKQFWKTRLKDGLITLCVLSVATLISQLLGSTFENQNNAHMVFLMAVMVISSLTNGYFWGLLTACLSVPFVNYMFTYPYYSFNLTLSGYLVTFVAMLAVSLMVSVLTTRIKQQEKLRQETEKEKLRANLLRAVSHDLRTPLTSIVGTTSAILENELDPAKQRELLTDVNTDAQWLLRMIENLLVVTRIQGQTKPLNVDVEVVEEVLAEAVIKFHKHFPDVAVDVAEEKSILLAEMDPVLIEQVVLNLLENAVYHGETTTRIVLKAERMNGLITVTVADNGAGIPKEKLNRLFDGSAPSGMGLNNDAQKHMGIGLSVCKSIVEAHGGTITAKNGEHGGASFSFTLPEGEYQYGD